MARLPVLLVVHELSRTGAPIAAMRTFRALADRVEATVLSPTDGPLRGEFEQFATVRVAPRWVVPDSRVRSVRRRVQEAWPDPVRRSLPGLSVRVVVVNSAAALPYLEELRLPAVPRILAVHELGALAEAVAGDRLRRASAGFDLAVANSRATVRSLQERFGWPGEKVRLAHPFADGPLPCAVEPGAFTVGGCGRWESNKGGALWLMVARRVADARPDARFVWFGVESDQALAQARHTVRQLGLEGRVELLGSLTDPRPQFARLDAFLCTSWEESFGLATLEAMAHGAVPIGVKGQGGVPEVIGEAGMVVERFDPEPLADTLLALAADPSRRSGLSEAARTRAAGPLGPAAQVEAWWAALDALPQA